MDDPFVLASTPVAVSLSVTDIALDAVSPVNVVVGERVVPVNRLVPRVWLVGVVLEAEVGARGPESVELVLLFVGEVGRELCDVELL